MNMKVRKSVIAFLMATTMVGSTAVPAMADTVTDKSVYKDNWLQGKIVRHQTLCQKSCYSNKFQRFCYCTRCSES